MTNQEVLRRAAQLIGDMRFIQAAAVVSMRLEGKSFFGGRGMNAKERVQLTRLERENAELRAAIAQHLDVYRNQAIELIELRAKIETLREVLDWHYQEGDELMGDGR